MNFFLLLKILTKLCSIYIFFAFFYVSAQSTPTILKKEKLREEDLITKEAKVGNLKLQEYLTIDIIKSIYLHADSFGKVEEDILAVPVYQNDKLLGYVFETYDVTRGLGYSRRPFHILVGLNLNGTIEKVKLVHHVEPIAILGRTDDDFHNYLDQFTGVHIKSGISLTLNLTGADIEGDNIAMRETAGETENLTQIEAIVM